MGYKHFKPIIKFASRKAAINKLNLTEKQFDKLTVLFGIYPVIADSKNCYDKADGWYYKIEDIKRIFFSETYETLNKNIKKDSKRAKLEKCMLLERAAKILNDEYNFVDLVKQKYESFGKSVDDLGNSMRNLYLIDLLKIDDVKTELEMFEKFVIDRKLLNKAFMSIKGVYFGFNIENIIVSWMVPYPGTDLNEIVEEKLDQPIEKAKYDFDFLDFGSLSEEESEEVEKCDLNDPNKLDISLLKYASPLLKIHLKLCIHKLNLIYNDKNIENTGIFSEMVFNIGIKSIFNQLKFAILACGGKISDQAESKYIITEMVELIDPEKIYIQPQFIFDCINQAKVLPFDLYLVGKELPPHISPFPNVIDTIDSRALKLLSNKKKYSILDRVERLN